MFSSNTSQVSNDAVFVEDVFSTYLYTGNGSTQTITNGIDLAGEGGLVWLKARSLAQGHTLTDTVRGSNFVLQSQTTDAQVNTGSLYVSAFNADGFSIGTGSNTSSQTFASWTFRKAPKFFDVVTWTGDGTDSRTLLHSLGSTPGAIIVKCTSHTAIWATWHRSIANNTYLTLNATDAVTSSGSYPIFATSSNFNSTSITLGGGTNNLNKNIYNTLGRTYVAYLFAHDAGGFGLTGTDNVISCGSYTGNGSASGPTINLGYEPQYVLIKNASATGYWFCFDNMRGIATGGADALLWPNVADAEANATDNIDLTSTGFQIKNSAASINGNGNTLIYIAIRRGPMKTPTTGTSVFMPSFIATSGAPRFTSNTPVDAVIYRYPRNSSAANQIGTRLLQGTFLVTNTTAAEDAGGGAFKFDYQTGSMTSFGAASTNVIGEQFSRAPGFFDVVCYTGTGSATTVSHNLGVSPELIITKSRSLGGSALYNWWSYAAPLGNGQAVTLNTTDASGAASIWNYTSPTSSVFSLAGSTLVNTSGATYVAYLFASCPGVSKVGSYTGTGTTQQINCGFTGGARFVLIKRTDSTGDWYVWDSARGIVAGNDPYLLLNSTAAEVTNTDYIDTYSAGFEISSTAPAAINASGGTFIYLAIA